MINECAAAIPRTESNWATATTKKYISALTTCMSVGMLLLKLGTLCAVLSEPDALLCGRPVQLRTFVCHSVLDPINCNQNDVLSKAAAYVTFALTLAQANEVLALVSANVC